jgi:hypothetical protein
MIFTFTERMLHYHTAQRVKFAEKNFEITSRKNRFDYFKELNEEFLSPSLLEQRKDVAQFWIKQKKVEATSGSNNCSIECPEISCFTESSDIPDLLAVLKDKLGIKVLDDLDSNFIEANQHMIVQTESVLNIYEHLGKLVVGKIITETDASLFFKTMIADTFIVCLPYILYRRKTKPEYAEELQAIIDILPKVSGNLGRV